jgi:hypothetical protein
MIGEKQLILGASRHGNAAPKGHDTKAQGNALGYRGG